MGRSCLTRHLTKPKDHNLFLSDTIRAIDTDCPFQLARIVFFSLTKTATAWAFQSPRNNSACHHRGNIQGSIPVLLICVEISPRRAHNVLLLNKDRDWPRYRHISDKPGTHGDNGHIGIIAHVTYIATESFHVGVGTAQ